MSALTIQGLSIRQDEAGRYCLNDLHRAAGGEPRHTPGRFTGTQQFAELADTLSRKSDSPVQPVSSAAGIGTFVAKQLVYAYAMWISAEFHLAVIDAYDAMVAPTAALPNFNDPVAAARAWADATERAQRATQALEVAQPKLEFVDRYVDATGTMGFRQVAKLLHANENRFREMLLDMKVMYRLGGEWVPYQDHIDTGRFEIRAGVSRGSNHAFSQARFTPKGVQWVAGLWARYQCQAETA